MRRSITVVMMVMLLVGFGGGAMAATTGSISVTVSLQAEIAVTVAPGTIPLGALTSLPSTLGPASATATVGNTTTKLEIKCGDGAGGWTLAGAPGEDQFRVTVSSPSLTLSTSDQVLDAGVAPYGSKGFDLTYNSPTADTKGGGVDQGFSVTVKASMP